eukprot:g45040.t1
MRETPFEIPDGKSDIIVEVMTQPLANCNIYGTSPQQTLVQPETQAAMTLDGKTLYEVINVVPVRRWKELMRLLELRDCDIERIEMDVAQSRDQQYEMLRQWSQQQASSMDLFQMERSIYSTGLENRAAFGRLFFMGLGDRVLVFLLDWKPFIHFSSFLLRWSRIIFLSRDWPGAPISQPVAAVDITLAGIY